jgi:hypothetical protein
MITEKINDEKKVDAILNGLIEVHDTTMITLINELLKKNDNGLPLVLEQINIDEIERLHKIAVITFRTITTIENEIYIDDTNAWLEDIVNG